MCSSSNSASNVEPITCVILPRFVALMVAVAINHSLSKYGGLVFQLALESLDAADDLHNLAGDLALTGAVVSQRQVFDHFRGVFGRALHGDHPGDLLAHC